MRWRHLLIASAIGLLFVAPTAAAAVSSEAAIPLAEEAGSFGARSSAFAPDLSPTGDKIVYLASGPGAVTLAHLRDVMSKQLGLIVEVARSVAIDTAKALGDG